MVANMNDKVQQLMLKLHISEDEALEILADDEAIDKGEKLFELTPEQKKASKKARITTAIKTEKKKKKKVDAYGNETEVKKKENPELRLLIKTIADSLIPLKHEKMEVTNPEHTIHIKRNGIVYKINLSKTTKDIPDGF